MAQVVNVNFRMDADVKNGMEAICSELGLTMTAAFNIFAKKLIREKRIPFDVSIDPFYSDDNLKRLATAAADAKSGINMSEHELIEEG